MKALDTNVIVRYLVQDDPVQARKASSFIENAEDTGVRILLSNAVLCEMVWVLDSAYEYSKQEIDSALEKLLLTRTFQFEAKEIVWAALNDYRSANADFADCLIGQLHRSLGAEPTMTFDLSLRKLATFQLL